MSNSFSKCLRWAVLCALLGGLSAATQAADFSGQLTTGNDKWNRMTTINVLSGQQVFYEAISIKIVTGGQYNIAIHTTGFAGALNTYAIAFNSAQSGVNFWDNGVVAGSPGAFGQTVFFAPGDYDLVISTNQAGETGTFIGSINGPGSVTIKPPPPLSILTNPFDTTISPGQSATLRVSTLGRAPKTFQWFQGNSGNTTNPIAGANDASFVTPPLSVETQYWVRVTNPDGSVDSTAATVFVTNGPIMFSGALTSCDDRYGRRGGGTVAFKLFRFRVTTQGSYTIRLQTTGFRGLLYMYDGIFLPSNPNVNFMGNSPIGTDVTLAQTLLASPNVVHVVIAGENANDLGAFTVTVTNGPALVTKLPAPEIVAQPTNVNIRRNQDVALNITSTRPDVTFKWFRGTCGARTEIVGQTSNSLTPSPLTQDATFFARLESPGGYLYSQPINLIVVPFAPDLNFELPQGTRLTIPAPGVLRDATGADGRTLSLIQLSTTAHGTLSLNANGAFVYQAGANYVGPDKFTFRVSDGVRTSNVISVNFLMLPTFANGTPNTIPSLGPAASYPATINVSGLTGNINKLIVTLNPLRHENQGDLDILLVGPQGQAVVLMSDANGDPDNPFVFDRAITFDDAATQTILDGRALFDGTYRPVNYGSGDSFPTPAPTTFQSPAPVGNATLASVFNGTDPNGEWKLFVFDDQGFSSGALGGWSLSISTQPPCQALILAPTTLPSGTLNTPFPSTQLTASGGTGAISFAVTAGALPDGVSLTAAGELRGTPTRGGAFNFTVTATDQYGCTGQRAYTLTVICPTINVQAQ
jgi:subtilisin-like proprotein convertase family protein